MKDKLPINPDRIQYPDTINLNDRFPLFRPNHYEKDIKYREIIIFCSSLINNMTWNLRLKFWLKGKYYKALIKTYDELLLKKPKLIDLPKGAKWVPSIDDYYVKGTREKMMNLCSNLLSQMSRFQRFRFTYLLQYHKALYITNKKNRKNTLKKYEKQKRISEKQNKKFKKEDKKK